MYIWTAIDIDDPMKEFRRQAKAVAEEYGLSLLSFKYPQHISLRISFEISEENFNQALEDIRRYLRTIKPFEIKTLNFERKRTFAFIPVEETEQLRQMHEHLCNFMQAKYSVPLHPFDEFYIYHTNVIIDEDFALLKKAFPNMENIPYPDTIRVNKFIIGCSNDGEADSFSVLENIDI